MIENENEGTIILRRIREAEWLDYRKIIEHGEIPAQLLEFFSDCNRLRNVPAVYIIWAWNKNELQKPIYVGQTSQLKTRIMAHAKCLRFSIFETLGVTYEIVTIKEKRLEKEWELIARCKPKFNTRYLEVIDEKTDEAALKQPGQIKKTASQ